MQISNIKYQKLKNFAFCIAILHFTFCILNFYGCATYPRRAEIKKPLLLADKTFRIGRTDYVYLRDFCRVYDLVWEWDVLGKRLVLYRENLKINLAFGSSLSLINEKRVVLQDKVKIHNHEIALPFSLSQEVSLIISSLSPAKLPPVSGIYRIKRIVIDPGHGGKDPGAVGRYGIKEKDVVLDIAKKLKRYLETKGIEVILTRNEDRFVSLWRRTHLANRKKADLFISIHANSSPRRETRGFEIYYLSDRMDDSAKALARIENAVWEFEEDFSPENTTLAAILWDIVQTQNRTEAIRLANYIGKFAERLDWIDNRGIKGGLFYVLKGANMPAILIETGFISNRIESKRLANSYYRQEIAKVIGEGILAYKEEYECTDGFTQECKEYCFTEGLDKF